MKTSFRIRIITMSLVALVAITFAQKTYASFNAYLEITDADGKITKVDVSKDGSFTSPALKSGRVKVQFFWDRSSGKSATLEVSGTPGGTATASNVRESSAPSVSEITLSYEILVPRDAQSGMASGKRQHKPPMNSKLSSSERLLPTVNKKLGSIEIDKDCDGITGKIEMKDQNGKTMAMDDWHQ